MEPKRETLRGALPALPTGPSGAMAEPVVVHFSPAGDKSGEHEAGAPASGSWYDDDTSKHEMHALAPPRTACARLGRSTVWALLAVSIGALALGLLLGLLLDRGGGETHAAQLLPTASFTLIIARSATLVPGKSKGLITVNGTVPGPTLRVQVGQPVVVTVISALTDDVTAIHWHGIEQRATPWSDGVPGTTQCPIIGSPQADGSSTLMYSFTSQVSGTYWYHGHLHEQYIDGLYGALIVSDPTEDVELQHVLASDGNDAAPYAADTLVWQVADWYDAQAQTLLPTYLSPASGGNEPTPDAIVVDNTFSWNRTTGLGFNVTLSRHGGPQRVRILNVAGFSMFTVSIDGLPLTVVEVDACAVLPLDLASVALNVAQRVSVVLDFSRILPALATSPSLWVRVSSMPMMYPEVRGPCLSSQVLGV